MAKRGKAVAASVSINPTIMLNNILVKSLIMKFLSEKTGMVMKKVGQYSKRHRVMQLDAS
jgi:hypothetical protein